MLEIDKDLAQLTFDSNCPLCGKILHQANYPRSPNGIPPDQREYYESRLSFCCSKCRARVTPESVRFFGRRWYPAPAHLLICLLKLRVSDKCLDQVKKHLGFRVSKSTLIRWKHWWQDKFMLTAFWKNAKGQLVAQPDSNNMILRFLFRLFSGSISGKLIALLKFLSPITGREFRGI